MKLNIFIVLCCMLSFSVRAQESFYTPLDLKKCKMIESSENDPNAEMDYFTAQCPGREGYDVIVSGGDMRSWIILKKNGIAIYDSRVDIFENAPGGFPYVAGGALEWRHGVDKKWRALIFRIAGQDDNNNVMDKPKDVSTLFVVKNLGGKFCLLGTSKTNEGARALADGEAPCKKTTP